MAAGRLQNPGTQQTWEVKLLEVAGNSAGGQKPQVPTVRQSLSLPEGAQEGQDPAGCLLLLPLQIHTAKKDLEKFHCSIRTYLCLICKKSIPQLSFRAQEVDSTKVLGAVYTSPFYQYLKIGRCHIISDFSAKTKH